MSLALLIFVLGLILRREGCVHFHGLFLLIPVLFRESLLQLTLPLVICASALLKFCGQHGLFVLKEKKKINKKNTS